MKARVTYKIRKLSEAIALVSIELIVVLVFFLVSLAILIVVIRQLFYRDDFALDQTVFNYFSTRVTATNTSVMLFTSFFGSELFLVPAWLSVLGFFYFIRKNKWYFFKLLTIAVSNLGLLFGLKYLFNRARPLMPLVSEAPGLSFPSGHAFMSFIFFGMIIHLVYRNMKNSIFKWISMLLLMLIIVVIGISRIYLRVHYFSDVIAGYCFGMLSLLLLLMLLRQIEKYNVKVIPPALNITKAGEDPLQP